MRTLARRLAVYLLAAWGSITLNFFLPRVMPGDPAAAMLARFRGKLSPEALAGLREAFGLTAGAPLAQYATYLRHLARGDLGVSIAYFPSPVSRVLVTGVAWTAILAGTAVLVSFAAGTLLGVVAARWRGGRTDAIVLPIAALLGAFPYFWLAMLALFVFGFELGWTPLGHAYDDDLVPALGAPFVASVARHALLPAITLVLSTIGGWMLTMRSSTASVLLDDHVLLARAKGLPERTVTLRYVARTALLPSLTGFGMAAGFVLSGSLLTEVVFSYPGQGYLLLQAVRAKDYPLMQGVFLSITLAVLAANALVDVAVLVLDPRTRAAAGGEGR